MTDNEATQDSIRQLMQLHASKEFTGSRVERICRVAAHQLGALLQERMQMMAYIEELEGKLTKPKEKAT